MKRGAVIAIVMLLAIAAALAFWISRQPSQNSRDECAGDPDYEACLAMEKRAEDECYGREDVSECLRALGLPIDEARLTESSGDLVP
jgi:hypothetical protein